MGNSTWIDAADWRELTRVLGECRELGDDPAIWRRHFYAALSRCVGAELILGGEVTGYLSNKPDIPGGTAWGLEHGFNRRGYEQLGELYIEGAMRSEMFSAQIHAITTKPGQGVIQPREHVLNDRAWDRSFDYQRISRGLGSDDCLHSLQPTGRWDHYDSLILCRAPGRSKFGDREVAIIDWIHTEMARMVGHSLAEYQEPAPSQLPRRARDVLRCLLQGDSDKLIALRLKLSPHTVNQYNKQIFHHFKVNSRSELLARWINRAWSQRADWEAAVDLPRFSTASARAAESSVTPPHSVA